MAGLIAGLISGGINLAKGVVGAVQAGRANKQLKELQANRPIYKRPKEITDLVSLYQQRAGISELPGQQNMESRMDASVASSIGQTGKYAPSSTAMLGAVTDIYGKKQEAIRDLATTFAQYKAQMQGELGGALKTGAEASDQEWYQNKSLPWQTKMNELTSQKQAGVEALWGGIEGIAGSAFALAGSQYQGQTGAGGQTSQSNLMPSNVKLNAPAFGTGIISR